MKKIILFVTTVLLLSSCSSDDSSSVASEPNDPTPIPTRSYRMMPCFSGCVSYNLPTDLQPTDFTIMKKRGTGEWKEQPVNSILWVQNNDSVWVRVNKPNGFIPNEINYLDYQVFNKDTLHVNSENNSIRFEKYNGNVNQKSKISIQLY